MEYILNTNNLLLLALFLVSGALLLAPILQGITSGQSLTPAAATHLMNKQKATLIDLRSEKDFSAGHITRAKNLPFEKFPGGLVGLKIDKSNPLILVCDSGSRSNGLLKKFRKEGFTDVASLDGGVKAWVTAGLPLVK
ncbi:MAG: rhodanese-like domain-containing protein [Betaproteobacteria bacterium]|jgi:rhodanese-related sulfurtransferase